MIEKLLSEYCPHCEQEFTVEWDINTDGWIVYCPHCGYKTYMCNMCDPNNMQCDTNNCPAIKQLSNKKMMINIY